MRYVLKMKSILSPHECGTDQRKRKVWADAGNRIFKLKDFNSLNQKEFVSGEITLKLDVSKVLKCIDHMIEHENGEEFSLEFIRENGYLTIDVERTGVGTHDFIDEEVVTSFLNDLFTIMNLCSEGVYDGFGNKFEVNPNTRNHFNPMEIDSNVFTDGWYIAEKWGWPNLVELDFNQAWDWYEKIDLAGKSIATSPIQKAIFCLQSMCDGNIRAYPTKLVEITQALESLMKVPGIRIASFLSERVHGILGEPASDKKWLNKVYETRSKIVHGSAASVRIGYHGDDTLEHVVDEYSWSVERMMAVLMALIQDLVVSKSTGYNFKTTIEKEK